MVLVVCVAFPVSPAFTRSSKALPIGLKVTAVQPSPFPARKPLLLSFLNFPFIIAYPSFHITAICNLASSGNMVPEFFPKGIMEDCLSLQLLLDVGLSIFVHYLLSTRVFTL